VFQAIHEVESSSCLGCGRTLSKAVVLPKDKDAELKSADGAASEIAAKEAKELKEIKADKISPETLAQLLVRYAECVPLNPSLDETDQLRALMNERRRLAKADKKRAKAGAAGSSSSSSSSSAMDLEGGESKSGESKVVASRFMQLVLPC
jgi:hypothetical protein